MLDDVIGVVVLSAGVGNDIVRETFPESAVRVIRADPWNFSGRVDLARAHGRPCQRWLWTNRALRLVGLSKPPSSSCMLRVLADGDFGSKAAWTLATLFPFRLAFRWLARWTGSIDKGPTPVFMTATILFVFGSAFMTDIIGGDLHF